jgi:hypothetical protein
MRYLKTYNEMIKVPIKVGDTVLGGRFKNKKVIVKKIGKNDKGDITINDKPLLKYRIVKESRISVFSQDIKKLLPKNLNLITTNGQFELELKDVMLNGDLVQIAYYHNTFEKSGDALGDGEPDFLEIDIHTLKDNDGTKANPDTLRLNIDISYGDSMMFSFTIDKINKVKVHHYDGINSKYDPETFFHFSDDTINDLVELFNRFDDYQLTSDDFNFLDSDPNSYQPNL